MSAVRMSSHLAKYAGFIGGWQAGLFPIPAALEDGLTRLREVHGLLFTIPAVTVQDTKRAWVEKAVQSAVDGDPLPTLDQLDADCATAARAERDREVLFQAIQAVALRVGQTIDANPASVLDGYVLPALVALLDEVGQARDDLGSPRTAEQALRGDETQRAAWVRLPDLSRRYDRLRDAALCLDLQCGGLSQYGLSHDLPDLSADVAILDVTVPTMTSDVVEA